MNSFETFLRERGLSENTVKSYVYSADQLVELFEGATPSALESYKSYLIDTFSAKTVNIRINGVNAYLEFLGQSDARLKSVRIQQKPFLENVISNDEYKKFVSYLRSLDDPRWYFAVKLMACTGARISELLRFDVDDIQVGYKDIISKGDKLRRIYIPTSLQAECVLWFAQMQMNGGALFLNYAGKRITSRGVSSKLKELAKECGIKPEVVYPHSFRHLFAKNFLTRCSDIAFLADLMGHESIETTRIYLRRTSSEQRYAVDEIVTW